MDTPTDQPTQPTTTSDTKHEIITWLTRQSIPAVVLIYLVYSLTSLAMQTVPGMLSATKEINLIAATIGNCCTHHIPDNQSPAPHTNDQIDITTDLTPTTPDPWSHHFSLRDRLTPETP